MPREMTFKQREVLEVVQTYWNEFRLPPSLDDLASRLDLERTTVHQHLLALKSKGFLSSTEGAGRTWRPSTELRQNEVVRIPVLGNAMTDMSSATFKKPNSWIYVSNLNEGIDIFSVPVTGNRLVDYGILDGDVVIVQAQDRADDGDLVVVRDTDGVATIVKLLRQRNDAQLQFRNDELETIVLQGDPVGIIGKVIAVQRRFS